jgi:hypothetical protein
LRAIPWDWRKEEHAKAAFHAQSRPVMSVEGVRTGRGGRGVVARRLPSINEAELYHASLLERDAIRDLRNAEDKTARLALEGPLAEALMNAGQPALMEALWPAVDAALLAGYRARREASEAYQRVIQLEQNVHPSQDARSTMREGVARKRMRAKTWQSIENAFHDYE